jgi:hypothetical protein
MPIQTNRQDYYSENGIIPEHIRQNGSNLEEFLESYYEWMQSSSTQPGHILNTILENRDIDKASVEFIEYLQREFATSIPQQIQADPRKLYKQVNDIYRSKGSIPSYEALFNLLFNDQIELYYPRVDLLKPSDGKWDQTQQRYLNNDGFISDKKYIQDSRYYQNFSYVIKTGQTIDYWQDAVKKLLHPTGFAFFGQILIQSFASKKYSQIPPGFVDPQEGRLPLILGTVIATPQGVVFVSMNFDITVPSFNALGASFLHLDQTKFVNPNPISDYADVVLQPVIEGRKTNITLPAEITLINT